MRLDTLSICSLLLVSFGCVSSSTRSDLRSVRDLANERSSVKNLALPALSQNADSGSSDPASPEKDPEVMRMLAQPLTVESAIRIAILNNRSLRADLLDLGVARGVLVEANVFPNPEFEASVRFSERRDVDPVWDLGFGFDITKIVLRGTHEEIAEAELDAARVRVAGATLDLALQTRLAYYALQHAEQRVALQKTTLDAFAASAETAQALFDAGNLTALDLVTEQAAYEGARADLSEAEALRMTRREQLAVLLGVFNQTLAVATQLAQPPDKLSEPDKLEDRAIEASLELAQARALLTAASRRIGLTEDSGSLPALHLGVVAEHEENTWSVGPALSGSFPMFDQNKGGTIAARAELNALRERYAASALAIRSAVRVARERAIAAQARALHYRDTLLPLRERVLRESTLQYNAMQLSVFQLLQARRDQLATSSLYLDALLEYWRARAEIDQLLAGRRVAQSGDDAASASSQRTAPDSH